jgi:acetate---CoA ligase (ADP-forming)
MPHPLDTFFAPDSIALIGASRDQEKIPGRLLAMLRKNEFPGKLYPVNPNYGDIDGLPCCSSKAFAMSTSFSPPHGVPLKTASRSS